MDWCLSIGLIAYLLVSKDSKTYTDLKKKGLVFLFLHWNGKIAKSYFYKTAYIF